MVQLLPLAHAPTPGIPSMLSLLRPFKSRSASTEPSDIVSSVTASSDEVSPGVWPPPSQPKSTSLFSVRGYLESLASVAVVTVRAYAHYASMYVPQHWTEAVEGALPAEMSRLLRLLLAGDDCLSRKDSNMLASHGVIIPVKEVVPFVTDPTVTLAKSARTSAENVTVPDSVTATFDLAPRKAPEAPARPIPPKRTDSSVDISCIPHNPPHLSKIQTFYTRTKPCVRSKLSDSLDNIRPHFMASDGSSTLALSHSDFSAVTEACGFPPYINSVLFAKVLGRVSPFDTPPSSQTVEWPEFERLWSKLYLQHAGDLETILFHVISANGTGLRAYIVPYDFEPIVRDVIAMHPSFDFLRSSSLFQDRYIETVIARLFYSKQTPAKKRAVLREFRKLKFLDMMDGVQRANTCLGLSLPPAFSYKDFYIVYCRFWELDTDRDMLLTASDLERYGNGALTGIVCRRIVDLYGTRGIPSADGRDDTMGSSRESWDGSSTMESSLVMEEKALTFGDFVTFLLSVEDKSTLSAIEYWFYVLDLDQDGRLSLLELETIWAWQKDRLCDFEPYALLDFFSVLLDTINSPTVSQTHFLTLSDLKRNPVAAEMIFDLLFDARKREEWARRTCDASARLADDLWVQTDPDETVWWEYLIDGQREDGRIRLRGWTKFADQSYRDLLGHDSSSASSAGSSDTEEENRFETSIASSQDD
ncbi:hypothetical protein DFS34DRAFT_628300 [Phlyctochytrium arcticum]|nr:hypothetical protein DFS34DRAFT_628300 [Phlyctochytrium arcticum]